MFPSIFIKLGKLWQHILLFIYNYLFSESFRVYLLCFKSLVFIYINLCPPPHTSYAFPISKYLILMTTLLLSIIEVMRYCCPKNVGNFFIAVGPIMWAYVSVLVMYKLFLLKFTFYVSIIHLSSKSSYRNSRWIV